MASVAQQFEQADVPFEPPIPLRPAEEKANAFPIDALGPLLGPAARAIMDIVRVPDGIAGQSVLGAASLALQGHINICLPRGQIRPTSLFLVTVSASGDRKTAADELALRAIYEEEERLRQLNAGEVLSHANAVIAHKEAATKIKKATKLSPTEMKDQLDQLGAEPSAPPQPFILATAPTAQGLQKLYMSSRPSLGLFSDEGGAFLGGYSMSDDNRLATSTILSEFWDGKPIKKVTSGEGFMFLPHRRLAFHLMLQPGVSLKLFGVQELKDQGFMSRILPSAPASIAGTRFLIGHTISPASQPSLEAYHNRLGAIIAKPMPLQDPPDQALKPHLVRLSDDACDTWVAFHDHVEAKIAKGGEWESIKGFAAKLPEHAARLAAVVANFAQPQFSLSVQDLAHGIALAEFYASEMLRLSDSSAVPDELAAADQLREWIVTKWSRPKIGLRHIQQNLTPASLRRIGAPKLKELCRTLEDSGHLVRIANGAVIDAQRCKDAWVVVGVAAE